MTHELVLLLVAIATALFAHVTIKVIVHARRRRRRGCMSKRRASLPNKQPPE